MNFLPEELQNSVSKLTQKIINEGFQQEALHEYKDFKGIPIYWRIRLKNHATGEKWIRPMRWIEGKGFSLGEPKFLNKKPLYNLHNLAEQSEALVWIVEGEWCADALSHLGVLSLTSGSADSVITTDWQPLSGREVIIWPDNDNAGERFAKAVISELRLLGCKLWQVNVDALNLPPKGDAVDWLRMNPQATDKEIAYLPLIDLSASEAETHELDTITAEKSHRENQASTIVNFVIEHMELFHDKNSDVYAQDLLTRETRRLDSRVFKDWLVSNYYEKTGKSPRDQSVREALSTLGGIARFKGECREVHIRVAKYENAYYLDLGGCGQSLAIQIIPGEWKLINNPPVRFLRPETMRQLPIPIGGYDLSSLWQMVNIPENDRLLVITWLIESLRPDTPFPVLELIGEQGSAKSTTQMVLRRLIDPNACDLRAAPKTTEDIFVSAGVNWVVSYENISHLSAPMQDTLCVLATGGGFAKRKLYSDADESVINAKRPVILNGISAAITAQDLIDRAISIETPVITKRTEINEILSTYEKKHPILLGALLDIFVQSLTRLPMIQLISKNCPRLIEFTRLGMAIAEVMGQTSEEFFEAFNACRHESIVRTIDASPAASALIEWFDKRNRQKTDLPLKVLFAQVEMFKPNGSDSWPRSPKGFGDALRRAAPALRQMGIECRSLGKVGSYISWEIRQCN
ncbi:DNA primase (bacterial type) [Legionella wadsworthii]|uniref:DNA primase (Bacterial type) n=1 Tax=Legionella wadsworthii TaxID=28088 RepID=A0A378LWI6_9GAMM|nr:hypothetical protein [Legionella wadsworthii]STY31506.1 DNA primase (bacterial type) [Legionella wadsworthii]